MKFIIQLSGEYLDRYVKVFVGSCIYIDTWVTDEDATEFYDWNDAKLVVRFLEKQGITTVIREKQ